LIAFIAANVALNRPSNQSTTSSTASGKLLAAYANDGDPAKCSATAKEVNPSWQIDLLQSYQVTGLRISSQSGLGKFS